uniref:La ribonucleoprotein 4Aa n=1 Tax=Poecilia formosa TaxID=48698 RepID=A0A096LZP2_POEFO
MDPQELGFSPAESTTGSSDSKTEEQVSSENLRESLKKELEFYFSRENLSKDLYLMSQMDSDQFVPIWTIASMEGIKVLTTDMELILDVLRSSPMVQVDEKGEKVRPNHKRCIIILREVPETTPVEEVESLFKNENCPKVISVEFAHNNNWYITFQSDTDAQQAYKYLREEVKTFQGKPIMARIKAINTFFAKNGYRSMDSSLYAQQSQNQSQYSSPLYMQHVYPQQQYPVYGIVPPTWTPSPTPYFETPLAPFPNSGFVNGFGSAGHYKAGSTALNLTRPFNRNRNRNHVKPQIRTSEVTAASITPVPLESLTGLRSPQPPVIGAPTSTHQTTADITSAFSQLSSSSSSLDPNDDSGMAGRGRRSTTYRGTRRRREEERNTFLRSNSQRPVPLAEVKVSPPKFDLAATNFPPLPGCVVSTQGEPVLENRMSDVVRGLYKPTSSSRPQPSAASTPATPSTPAPSTAAITTPAQCPDDKKLCREGNEGVYFSTTLLLPTDLQNVVEIECLTKEPRKLSYAEVCQRPPKDPPPAAPAPSGTASGQPLRELRVNKAEEPGSGTSPGEFRDQRRPPPARRGSPQGGFRLTGKEQNIPPVSPK